MISPTMILKGDNFIFTVEPLIIKPFNVLVRIFLLRLLMSQLCDKNLISFFHFLFCLETKVALLILENEKERKSNALSRVKEE